MLLKLSPYVKRQARRLCRATPALVDDAYAEGRLRIWELLQQGIRDEAYLLRSSANRIRNFLAHERYEPQTWSGTVPAANGGDDALERVPDQVTPYEEALCRVWLSTLHGSLRTALEKELFTQEAKTQAERVALHRFRRSALARTLAAELALAA